MSQHDLGVRPVLRSALVFALLAVVVGSLTVQPDHGSILIALSPGHGVDVFDLAAIPPLCLATVLAVEAFPEQVVRRSRVAAPAVVTLLGMLTGLLGGLDLSRINRQLNNAFNVGGPAVWGVVAVLALVTTTAAARPWPRHTLAMVSTAVVIVGAGIAVDVALLPSGTLFSAASLAGYLVTKKPRRARTALVLLVVAFLVVSAASLADVGGMDVFLSRSEGGGARGVAFGAVLLVGHAAEALSRPFKANASSSNQAVGAQAEARPQPSEDVLPERSDSPAVLIRFAGGGP